MTEAYELRGHPDGDILIVADHASSHVPSGIDLGIDPAHLREHIAIDIGVAEVAAILARESDCYAILGGVSRLVIDYNREADSPSLVPVASDGIALPGNVGADVTDRIQRFYGPYHDRVAQLAGAAHAPFILSLHSFTPQLRTRPAEERPWEIGILYNEDDRCVSRALSLLGGMGWTVGDQQPYSGKLLNATMNRHAEAFRRPYLGVEIRQDLIAGADGQRKLADSLLRVVRNIRNFLQDAAA